MDYRFNGDIARRGGILSVQGREKIFLQTPATLVHKTELYDLRRGMELLQGKAKGKSKIPLHAKITNP